MYNPFSLEDKTIFVTGASSGIGKATAIECSRLGASVIITGRNESRLQEVLSALTVKNEQSHQMIVADLTTEDGLEVKKVRNKSASKGKASSGKNIALLKSYNVFGIHHQ